MQMESLVRSFPGAKATSVTSGTSPCHPRDPALTRTCLSSPRPPLRSQHHHCSALGKSCSPPRSAWGWLPLWEGFLLSPLCRWCHWQVSALALLLCKNTQLVAVGWGVPPGSVIPYGMCVTSNAAPFTQSFVSLQPCPRCGATLAQRCAHKPSPPLSATLGRWLFIFTRTCPKRQGRAALGCWQCCCFPTRWGKQASHPAVQGRFLRCTNAGS